MDEFRKSIIEAITPMSPEAARVALANGEFYAGEIGSPYYKFALSLIETKESVLREAREAENLVISRKALRNSNWATIIAIIAMILSAITIIVPLLIKK